MVLKLAEFEALSTDANQFRFTCPIFNSEVAVADCFTLHDRHMIGKREASRAGCHACMSSSKCPVRPMLQESAQNSGRYLAATRTLGRISDWVKERIDRILVPETVMNAFEVTLEERAAIRAACAHEIKSNKTPRPSISRQRIEAPAPKPSVEKETFAESLAAANDLAGAVSKAAMFETIAAIRNGSLTTRPVDDQPHTIPPADAPHNNPRFADVGNYVGPPVELPPAKAPETLKNNPLTTITATPKALSLLELARQMKEKKQ